MGLRRRIFLVGLAVCILGCGGGSQAPAPASPAKVVVHFSGYQFSDLPGGGQRREGMVWTDGVPWAVAPGQDALAASVALDGDQPVAAGTVWDAFGGSRAVVWRRGGATTLVTLSGRDGGAQSLAMAGGQWVVAGWETQKNSYSMPALWVNGVPQVVGPLQFLEEDCLLNTSLTSASWMGGKPVGAGSLPRGRETMPNDYQVDQGPVAWSGGQLDRMVAPYDFGQVNGVAVNRGHLVAVGTTFDAFQSSPVVGRCQSQSVFSPPWSGGIRRVVGPNLCEPSGALRFTQREHAAVVWEEGQCRFLDAQGHPSVATAVCASEGVVYAVGYVEMGGSLKPVLWRDGVATALMPGTGGGMAVGVAVLDGHVYVGGTAWEEGNARVALWRDGVISWVTSADRDSWATGLALQVVP